MGSWSDRVETYVDQLQDLVEEIDAILQQTNVESRGSSPATVQALTERLRGRLGELEQKVAHREELLRSEDAPSSGVTLTEKLDDAGQNDLADRAREVAQRIKKAHERSMSLFVCQYHLSNLTTDLVRLIAGADQVATYDGSGTAPPVPQGGLFNESA